MLVLTQCMRPTPMSVQVGALRLYVHVRAVEGYSRSKGTLRVRVELY